MRHAGRDRDEAPHDRDAAADEDGLGALRLEPAEGCLHIALLEAEKACGTRGEQALHALLVKNGAYRIEDIGAGK